ncbi:TMEM175 family protein [Nocardioides sp.]|uniref:TMEM175 family protein n=1 Tax=Nocardioides sp. TaxID=35761 RepID=UPI003D14E466
MSDQGQAAERTRDLGRLLTFVDAVVAIAITLLVLPLVDLVPDLQDDASVVDLLREHQIEIGGFLLSFVVISSLWSAQHKVMSTVVAEDPVVSRLLMLWTLTIVFLPFPTALVAQEGHAPVTKILYIGTMAVSSTCLALIAGHVGRHRALRDTDRSPDPRPAWVSAVALVIALGLSLLVPALSYWPLLLLLLTGPTVRLWRRQRS